LAGVQLIVVFGFCFGGRDASQAVHEALLIVSDTAWQVTRRYVSDVSMDELRVVIAAKERAASQHATPESLTLELENA